MYFSIDGKRERERERERKVFFCLFLSRSKESGINESTQEYVTSFFHLKKILFKEGCVLSVCPV
jgi:hypothetical protein